MKQLDPSLTMSRRVRQLVVGLLTAVAVLAPTATIRAEGKKAPVQSSLDLVPAQVSHYASILRGREQIELIAKSKAWANLTALPQVQQLLTLAKKELHSDENPVGQFLAVPKNRELLSLLGDLAGEEMFVCSGENFLNFFELSQHVAMGANFGPLMLKLTSQDRGLEPNYLPALAILRVLNKHQSLIQIPDLVFGFRISEAARAEEQFKRLDTLLTERLENNPRMKGRIKRTKLGTGDFLTISFDGAMIPWKEIPFKELEATEGEFDDLVKKIKQMKLVVSLGIRDNYVLLGMGESTSMLAKLGEGPSLRSRPEFKKLAPFADRRLTSVGYVSEALMKKSAENSGKQIEELARLVKTALPQAPIPEEARSRIKKDVDRLMRGVKSLEANPGAWLSFSYLTEHGQESYEYAWGDHQGSDTSKPLTLLEHAGGDPLVVVVGRSTGGPKFYHGLAEIVKTLTGYFDDYGVTFLNDVQRDQYEKLTKQILYPIFRRIDQITTKTLLPACGDGQKALVIDAKLTSKQWLTTVPPLPKAMPIPEIALVIAVSDAAGIRKAFSEYRTVINDGYAKVRELAGGTLPEFEIPAAASRQLDGGTMYYYPLPEGPQDKRLLPNVALSDKVLVLSMSAEHSQRLLKPTPFTYARGPLADLKKPLLAATYVNWAGLMHLGSDWLELGIKRSGVKFPPIGDKPPRQDAEEQEAKKKVASEGDTEDVLRVMRAITRVLTMLQNMSSCTYLEDGVLVTHSEAIFQDK